MGLDLEEDRKRRPVELSLRAARKRQSSQTGFVHHCYESENEKHDTIPLFENFCFVLALLRSKQSENMLEGLNLLSKLLKLEQEGNFPVYFHELPACRDRLLGLKLLAVFHAILFDFHPILESALQQQLQQLIGRILSFGNSLHDQGGLPQRYALLLKAYDDPHHLPLFEPTTPDQMADALIAAHMARCRGATVAIEPIIASWHRQLLTYTGPQEQEKAEPKPTLFDLFLSDYSRNYPARVLCDHPMHLKASLVYSMDGSMQGSMDGSMLDASSSGIPFQSISSHPRQPYTLYWGSPDHLHSLVCDPKEMRYSLQLKENSAEFLFTSTAPASLEGPVELAFFYNIHPAHDILVNGRKATAFQLGDVLEIHSDGMKFEIVFSLEEGEGAFYGHLSRGNRPLQTAAKGASRYEAFDWQIGLRTIRRSDRCVVRALIAWDVSPQ
jgi:hypothetical protein